MAPLFLNQTDHSTAAAPSPSGLPSILAAVCSVRSVRCVCCVLCLAALADPAGMDGMMAPPGGIIIALWVCEDVRAPAAVEQGER